MTPVRLAYLVSHPIQYQAPLLRRIAREPDIDLHVFFGTDISIRRYKDEGFGVDVHWDVPLLEGYSSEFLPRLRDTGRLSPASPINRGIYQRLRNADGSPAYDALWIHGYATINCVQAILAANLLGIPVLLRAEGWLGDRKRTSLTLAFKDLFFHDLRHLIDAVLPIGSRNARYWRRYLGHAVPQFPMPYAVDNDWFAQRAAATDTAALRAELQLDDDRPVILFASKLQHRKHCDHLVAAYTRYVASVSAERAPYLLIAGDGEQRAELEARCRELGLTHVRFVGFRNQTELPALFRLATVFVLPSRHEPWGLVVNEAMACGCPVILSDDVGCTPDLVSNGVEGCIYPYGDIEALTGCLAHVLASPERAAAMGCAAQKRIQGWSFEDDIRGLRMALEHTTRRLRA